MSVSDTKPSVYVNPVELPQSFVMPMRKPTADGPADINEAILVDAFSVCTQPRAQGVVSVVVVMIIRWC